MEGVVQPLFLIPWEPQRHFWVLHFRPENLRRGENWVLRSAFVRPGRGDNRLRDRISQIPSAGKRISPHFDPGVRNSKTHTFMALTFGMDNLLVDTSERQGNTRCWEVYA